MNMNNNEKEKYLNFNHGKWLYSTCIFFLTTLKIAIFGWCIRNFPHNPVKGFVITQMRSSKLAIAVLRLTSDPLWLGFFFRLLTVHLSVENKRIEGGGRNGQTGLTRKGFAFKFFEKFWRVIGFFMPCSCSWTVFLLFFEGTSAFDNRYR
jgi:hypothetical protein